MELSTFSILQFAVEGKIEIYLAGRHRPLRTTKVEKGHGQLEIS